MDDQGKRTEYLGGCQEVLLQLKDKLVFYMGENVIIACSGQWYTNYYPFHSQLQTTTSYSVVY